MNKKLKWNTNNKLNCITHNGSAGSVLVSYKDPVLEDYVRVLAVLVAYGQDVADCIKRIESMHNIDLSGITVEIIEV